MENAVRYVHIDDASFKPALCFRGEKIAYAIIQGIDQIQTVDIELKDYDKSNSVLYHGTPYNTKAYADRLLMAAKAASKPISRRAHQLLIGLGEVPEEKLLPEEIELEDIRILSDHSPREKARESRRPGPVRDLTAEYKAREEALPHPAPVPRGRAAKPPAVLGKGAQKAPEAPPKRLAAPHKTATAVRTAKPAPVAEALPPKGPKIATREVRSTVKPKLKYDGRGQLVQQLADELKTDPKSLRVRLRAAGLKAPYDDIGKMRKALK